MQVAENNEQLLADYSPEMRALLEQERQRSERPLSMQDLLRVLVIEALAVRHMERTCGSKKR